MKTILKIQVVYEQNKSHKNFLMERVIETSYPNTFIFINEETNLGNILPKGAAAAAKSLKSCLTLFHPINGSPPGSPVLGILQARTLEWVAISFSNA